MCDPASPRNVQDSQIISEKSSFGWLSLSMQPPMNVNTSPTHASESVCPRRVEMYWSTMYASRSMSVCLPRALRFSMSAFCFASTEALLGLFIKLCNVALRLSVPARVGWYRCCVAPRLGGGNAFFGTGAVRKPGSPIATMFERLSFRSGATTSVSCTSASVVESPSATPLKYRTTGSFVPIAWTESSALIALTASSTGSTFKELMMVLCKRVHV